MTARISGVTHAYSFGGGLVDDENAPPEDCYAWLPEHELFVLAAGVGFATGLVDAYFPAWEMARAAAGFASGWLTGQPSTGPDEQIQPPDALRHVAWARQIGATRRGAAGGVPSPRPSLDDRVMGFLIEALKDAMMPILRQISGKDYELDHFVGRSLELAVMDFSRDHVEFVQVGAIAVYRQREGVVESVAPIGNLAGEALRDGHEVPPGLRTMLTLALSVRPEGIECREPLRATIDLRPGDRLLVLTRGVHDKIDDQAIAECMLTTEAAGLRATVEAIIAAVERSPGRRSDHPTAVAFAIDGS